MAEPETSNRAVDVSRGRRVQALVAALVVSSVVLTQGPLLWLLVQGHDSGTILAIFRHAPNQFVFLLIFFPIAAIVVGQLIVRFQEILWKYPAVTNSGFVRHAIARGWGYAIALALAITLALIDHVSTPADFYGKAPAVAREAAALSEELAADNTTETHLSDVRARLGDLYAKPDASRILSWFEAVELAAAANVAFLIGLACLVSLRLRLLARRDDALRRDVRKLAMLLILAVLAFSPWCPLRAHNISQIRAIVGTGYTTTEPAIILGLLFIIVLYAFVTFFKDLTRAARALRRVWAGVIALGGMGAIAWFTVEPTHLGEALRLLSVMNLIATGIAVFMLYFLVASLMDVEEIEQVAERLADESDMPRDPSGT